MASRLLATKLYVPQPGPKTIRRPRLVERLNEGLHGKLTLVSAPAGFGKTTMIGEWVAQCEQPIAWLALDDQDNDPARFLAYLVAALQKGGVPGGDGLLAALQSPQPPPLESILTVLVNEMAAVPGNFVLVLDDYHLIEAEATNDALAFVLDHLPEQIHLVIATREDPQLPLARLRARGQLAELRVADLRFTPAEAAAFLNQAMRLKLSTEAIDALERRTEGWIAGLQLAALSMQSHHDPASFIRSFTGSHHFVLDYLTEEVLQQQSESVQSFLLHTSILDRLCGSLCDALLRDSAAAGQATLEYLERANLFLIPLDDERRWYRYHHLFADLLRQRLQQIMPAATGDDAESIAQLHRRASQWYEDNGLWIEAFQHAAAANDVERAELLIDTREMPLHFRDAVKTMLDWFASLPTAVLDARPSLWAKFASLSLVVGQNSGVEAKLQAAEAALQHIEIDGKTRNLIGRIAATRATLALSQYRVDAIFVQSRRALEYLPPDDLPYRATALWTLGVAYFFQGDRAAANRACTDAVSISQASGDIFFTILAEGTLANIQEVENQLYPAAETYRHVLNLYGDHPQPNACEAHLGLARIAYEWNDLETAARHAQQGLHLARQYERGIDRFVIAEVFLARLKLAQGDPNGAEAILAEANQFARQNNFIHRFSEIAAAQVLVFLRQGNLTAAATVAQAHELPVIQARVFLAQGNVSGALQILEAFRQQMDTKGWADERLKVMILQAIALDAYGDRVAALQVLAEVLALAEPGGFVRTFLDEGTPMADLIVAAAAQGIMPDYTAKLLDAFDTERAANAAQSIALSASQALVEPLSPRELEILALVAEGLSNREIGERLFLALDTVKGHNRRIYEKLQVQRRTEAIARARELGLLQA